MPRRSPFTSVTPALSIATSVPVPMAMPTSAAASAGASLMPSPAIATTRPSPAAACDRLAFLLRQHLGLDLVDAELAARRPRRCVRLSPVSMTMRRPSSCRALDRLRRRRLDRIGDADAARRACRRPRRTPPSAPSPRSAVGLVCEVVASRRPARRSSARVAERDGPAVDRARDALAGDRLEVSAVGEREPARLGAGRRSRRPADARCRARALAARRSSSSSSDAAGRHDRRRRCGLPSVSVPVLSTTSVSTLSSARAPRRS